MKYIESFIELLTGIIGLIFTLIADFTEWLSYQDTIVKILVSALIFFVVKFFVELYRATHEEEEVCYEFFCDEHEDEEIEEVEGGTKDELRKLPRTSKNIALRS